MERKILICDCHNLEHQVSFWYDQDDDSLYIEPHLVTHRNFLKRLYIGIKYAFGYKSRYGEFDEIVLSPESQKELMQYLKKYK